MKKGKVTIVGAGQAGLLLGIALLKNQYDVSIFSDRTAEQVYNGHILSNQAMFDTALSIERKFGLNFWDNESPNIFSTTMTLLHPTTQHVILSWTGRQKRFYQSIDQRMKFSRWLNEFEKLGGTLTIKKTSLNDLLEISENSDLTIVSTGKGELSTLFTRDERYSAFSTPQRILCCLYVKNMPSTINTDGVHVTVIPGIGEYFVMPGLTHNGHCHMMQFEGIPGQAFDSWSPSFQPNDFLEHAVNLLEKFIPFEAARCKNLELCDQKAYLSGTFTPVIRNPIAKLSNNRFVFGLGDTVVLNDPLAGQGANNATKAANVYFEEIIKNTTNNFNETWMNETYEKYWNTYGKWTTRWSNILLSPPPDYVFEFLQFASENETAANILANGFNNPDTLFPWIENAEETRRLIKGIRLQSKSIHTQKQRQFETT